MTWPTAEPNQRVPEVPPPSLTVKAAELAKEIVDDEIEERLFELGSDLAHDLDPILGGLTDAIIALEKMAPWPKDQAPEINRIHSELMDEAMEREGIGAHLLAREIVNQLAQRFGPSIRGGLNWGAQPDTKETDDHNDNPSD